MIPLRDDVPTKRFPIVCVSLIVLNVLVFLLDRLSLVPVRQVVETDRGLMAVQMLVGGLSHSYAMIPAYVTGNLPIGQIAPPNAWLTLFTSMFLHANWLHVGGNMLYLWIFGNNIEDALGRGKFLLFYFACGLGAAGAHILSDPASMTPTVGASGAIAGVMGAYLLLYPGARVLCIVPLFGIISTLMYLPAPLVLIFWIVLQVINSQFLRSGDMMSRSGGVAYVAHIGGFVIGMVLISLLGGRRKLATEERVEERPARREWERERP